MAERRELAIGIDLGGTKILAALITKDGDILSNLEVETLAAKGPDVVYQQVVSSVHKLIRESQVNKNRLLGIGIAAAGVINMQNKEVIFANNTGWRNMPIGELLESEFELPVHLVNDANAAAIAERIWGAGKGAENLVYITVSTGIGAGIISDGRLITGEGDSAGEFGHISIDVNGSKCGCGNRGCLENLASGTAIAKTAKEKLRNGEYSEFFTETDSPSAEEIGKASLKGDTFSQKLLKETATYLGVGVTNMVHILNTGVIVFGGGVMNLSDILLPEIKKTVNQRGIPSMVDRVNIVKSELGMNAGVLGAVGYYFEESGDKVLASTEK
ncbi:ROK family protein [Thalassobacillus pellis]|uniref:ROK family protein n=1 Tax=Thalassobacillus pellis TaxID=748008 RepID=UPI00196187DA|nr:ROK family protein [Thalassobacillus pellis]MBM7551584.1 glucokinase [Thalassobacillus pellis]